MHVYVCVFLYTSPPRVADAHASEDTHAMHTTTNVGAILQISAIRPRPSGLGFRVEGLVEF
jgi:hypothetical protein